VEWSGGGALVLVYEPAEKVDPFDRVAVTLGHGRTFDGCLEVEAAVRRAVL
jgi:hypothetical protein